jgi:hypothetical protein
LLGERTYDGKRIHGTEVWTFIAHTSDGCRAEYYCYGIRNDAHRCLALEWSGELSSHVRFHLLGHGFDAEGINDLIQGSFDLQATKEVAQAVVGNNRQVKSQRQAEAEKVLLNHNRT